MPNGGLSPCPASQATQVWTHCARDCPEWYRHPARWTGASRALTRRSADAGHHTPGCARFRRHRPCVLVLRWPMGRRGCMMEIGTPAAGHARFSQPAAGRLHRARWHGAAPLSATCRSGEPHRGRRAAYVRDPRTVNLGNPAWQASPPYGTDMIIAVASSEPLFDRPRPSNAETVANLSARPEGSDRGRRHRGVRMRAPR